jgi:hypothetical protein
MEEAGLKREILGTESVGNEIRFGSKLSIYEQQLLVGRLNDALDSGTTGPSRVTTSVRSSKEKLNCGRSPTVAA